MLKRVFLLGLGLSVLLATSYADQGKKILIPVKHTDPTSGQQMYSSYCAPCHGVDARGNGPVANRLAVRPTDLTTLSRSRNGKFPEHHVMSVLRFGAEHSNSPMPQWDRLLGNMTSSVYQQQERDLRASNLTRYLQSIQVK